MKPSLKRELAVAKKNKVAIAHFNISEFVTLKACWDAARELSVVAGRQIPLIIGVSEGEQKFLGTTETVDLITHMRKNHQYPIFLNADHHKSVESCKEAIDAGFDSVIIDAADKSLEENIRMTKEVVAYARAGGKNGKNKKVLIEAELGFIGSGSEIKDELPSGVAITEETITKVDEAKNFVDATGVDLLAPSVGNAHGLYKSEAFVKHLFEKRIKAIRQAVKIPLVLHGGSGTPDEDFVKAVEAGVRVVHISTELRKAWRGGIEKSLAAHPQEVAPYKLLEDSYEEVKAVVVQRLKLFNKLS
jgi:fructose-bisphosphate aldolase class II